MRQEGIVMMRKIFFAHSCYDTQLLIGHQNCRPFLPHSAVIDKKQPLVQGKWNCRLCGVLQMALCFATGIGYTYLCLRCSLSNASMSIELNHETIQLMKAAVNKQRLDSGIPLKFAG